VEHKQLPFPAVHQTPAQTYQTSHPQSEWENIFFFKYYNVLLQFPVAISVL